jgi:hypothetical protein
MFFSPNPFSQLKLFQDLKLGAKKRRRGELESLRALLLKVGSSGMSGQRLEIREEIFILLVEIQPYRSTSGLLT